VGTTKWQSRIRVLAVAVAVAVGAIGCAAPGGATVVPSPATSGPSATSEKVGASDAPIVLRMANAYGDLGRQLPGVRHFVDRVHELSDGAITITVAHSYGDFAPDVEQRIVSHVAAGNMDLAWVGTRVLDTMGVKSFQALTAPMLVDSYALQDAIIESGMTNEMLPSLDDVGVVGLGVLADGLRKPIGVDGPIVGPADWEGIGFGTYKSDGQEQAIRALGATPALVFGPNREAAFADRTIDGFEFGLVGYNDPKWIDPAPYVTSNVNLWPQMDLLIANPARLEALTSQEREWLQKAADDAAGRSADIVDTEAEAMAAACDAGARFAEASEADLAALDESFAPVYASLEQDAETKAFIKQIRALSASIPAEPDPVIPAGCSGTVSP
jgi:TRAP-type C4-dicarboxylate transport system substrate-binding protein